MVGGLVQSMENEHLGFETEHLGFKFNILHSKFNILDSKLNILELNFDVLDDNTWVDEKALYRGSTVLNTVAQRESSEGVLFARW